jgi:uncharacterized repeat protein (TIGR03803 family)
MRLLSSTAALLLLAGATAAYGTDSYTPSNKHLAMPSVAIGDSTYTDMVVTVGAIVTGPSGAAANGSEDRYDPGTNQLTVQSVTLGSATYYNVVVTVAALDSIGSVSGADSYGANGLAISFVQVGGTVYDNVLITVGGIVSVAGGMPTSVPDTYNAMTNQLAVPAAQVGSQVYTNSVITVGKLLSVGGVFSNVAELVGHSFSGQNGTEGLNGSTDGADPTAELVQGSDHNFYGTTYFGGAYDVGTVFRITPGGVETVLYSFTGVPGNGVGGVSGSTDGAWPDAGLIEGKDGNFYGTTEEGGANANHGTVFMITPQGVETVIYSFCAIGTCKDGNSPRATLILGSDGNFYGTTPGGGASNVGNVYQMTPGGTLTTVYSFLDNSMDGTTPEGSVIQDSAGNFYGTTFAGGSYGYGIIYKVTPAGEETILHSFCAVSGCPDGEPPNAGLLEGVDGNFYGMTSAGGAYNSGNSGTVFRITPAGAYTVLHSFCGTLGVPGCTDGGYPVGSLIQASDGNIYGATRTGGANNTGSVFKITATGVETVVYSFDGDSNSNTSGFEPIAGLVQGIDGNFYGTTNPGSTYGEGNVYRLSGVIPIQ